MLTIKWIPVLCCFSLALYSCSYNKAEAFDPSGSPVDFQKDIKPIIVQNCVMCHSDTATHPDRPGYALFLKNNNDFSEFRKFAIATSSANASYTKIPARLRGIESPAMPFNKPSLPDSTIKKIEKWIKQGAVLN